jgi:hypothetical protein
MPGAPDPGQGSLFAAPAEPEPAGHGIDPHIGNHAYVRRDARPTSQIAAAEALPRSTTQRDRVFEVIRQAGPSGLTDQEIAVKLGLAENSVRPRRLELITERRVADSGRTRDTSTGKPATVWVAASP